MSSVEVLLSAMNQEDDHIFQKTNISSDALLINQCEHTDTQVRDTSTGKRRIISTTERGLSKSRNMALENARGDICLFCDDDEYLYDTYPKLILSAYEKFPKADIICFQIKREGKQYPQKSFKIRHLTSLKISSVQITCKRKAILKKGIKFDENFGSGTACGAGEENIFLFDCLNAQLNLVYVPLCIGELTQKNSNWFHGFDEDYFFHRGMIIRRLMGPVWGLGYCLYFVIAKYNRYRKNCSMHRAFRRMLQGLKNYKNS